MESSLQLVEGTAALSPAAELVAEFVKDRWDARNIPGLRYAAHSSHYHIRFQPVPHEFRQVVKEYAKYLIAAGRVVGTIDSYVRRIGHFLAFFMQRYPQVLALHALSAQDIDAFIVQLRADVQQQRLKNSNTYVNSHIQSLSGWLSYLERTGHAIKPDLPISRIIWPHHYPPLDFTYPGTSIKYIPQSVLEQLDRHLHHLTSTYIPVMIVLRVLKTV